jgi:hypothetical protein
VLDTLGDVLVIEIPTVFVLGAGASSAFGFPLGLKLRDQIATHLDDHQGIRGAACRYYGYEWHQGTGEWIWPNVDESPVKAREQIVGETDAFKAALLDSPIYSIDAFLEYRPEFEELGKIAIAATLIPHELKTTLSRKPDKKRRWIDELFDKMRANPASFADNQVSIITFNYDRSIEYFFRKALKSTYGLGEDSVADLVESISIVHIHGQLGEPHFLSDDGRDYKDDTSRNSLRTAVDSMRIIYEQLDESLEYQRAHELIAQAEILCFLGFGYHRENMRRLAVTGHFQGERLLGTCFGMEDNERRVLEKRFGYKRLPSDSVQYYASTVFSQNPYLALGNQSEDAYIFLRKYPVFDH